MRPFAVYPASFDGSTLGWWRFGERGGRLDSVVAGGPAFTNYGAAPLSDGYGITFSPNTYLQAPMGSQPAQSALTLEAWIRSCSVPSVGGYRTLLYYADSVGHNWVDMLLYRAGANDLRLWGRIALPPPDQWTVQWADNAAITALLASPAPWHVAVVTAAAAQIRLFVNGTLRAETSGAVPTFPAKTMWLDVGCRDSGYGATAILDEVRLSAAARYASNFPIVRFGEGRRLGLRGPECLATAGGIP